MTTDQLCAMANEAQRRWPTAKLTRNLTGNLNVLANGEWVAYLDLNDGTIHAAHEEDHAPTVADCQS